MDGCYGVARAAHLVLARLLRARSGPPHPGDRAVEDLAARPAPAPPRRSLPGRAQPHHLLLAGRRCRGAVRDRRRVNRLWSCALSAPEIEMAARPLIRAA